MGSGRAQAVWAARRALVEETGATVEHVALACRLDPDALAQRAAKDGWKPREAAGLSRAQRIARVHDFLLDRIESGQRRAEAQDAPLDKASIAELAATARVLAKIGEIAHDEDDAKEKRLLERDADIATILDRLDRRIVELARHLAKEMAESGVLEAGARAGEP